MIDLADDMVPEPEDGTLDQPKGLLESLGAAKVRIGNIAPWLISRPGTKAGDPRHAIRRRGFLQPILVLFIQGNDEVISMKIAPTDLPGADSPNIHAGPEAGFYQGLFTEEYVKGVIKGLDTDSKYDIVYTETKTRTEKKVGNVEEWSRLCLVIEKTA
mgnify:CR=1 FL=1